MNWSDYVIATSKFIVYPEDTAKQYLTYSLIGEVGELIGLIAKQWRGDTLDLDKVAKEIGDVLFFIARISELYDCGMIFKILLSEDNNNLEDILNSANTRAELVISSMYSHDYPYDLNHLLWAVLSLIHYFDLSLDKVLQLNYDKLEDRFNRNMIRGNGDER